MNVRTAVASKPQAPSSPAKRLQRRHWLFLILNILVLAIVSVGILTNEFVEPGLGVYVSTLFLICTSPLIAVTNFRGPASLLLMFLGYYFGTFGLKDLSDLIAYEPIARPYTSSIFTIGEISIIVGVICFIVGYTLTALLIPKRTKGVLTKDWSLSAVAVVGILAWMLGFYITVFFQFGIGDLYGSTTTISATFGGFLSLLRMLQPLGSLLLIYLFLTTKNKAVLAILLATMVADVALGFLGDSKEIAIRAPLLYIVSVALMRERLPVVESIVFITLASIVFSFFAAYRLDLHTRHQSRGDALENIESKLDNIYDVGTPFMKRISDGIDYFADRITLKQNMEIILERTGKDVEFQNGNTISPLLYAFIPRFIAPNKPDNSGAGKIFSREFRLSPDPNTYISIGHVGELYWNYGWPGLVIGMMIIGFVMASIATLLRLDINPSLPKFLILLMSIYLLTLRFEGALAMTYTVWARTLVMLLLLNAIIPKRNSVNQAKHTVNGQAHPAPQNRRILKAARRG